MMSTPYLRMKRLFLCLLAIGVAFAAMAQKKPSPAQVQKKAIDQAKAAIKSGKNLDKVEKQLADLLVDSTYSRNEKIWHAYCDIVKAQYDQGNEKLYLKQKYDTTTLFTTARKLFLAYETLDSIEASATKKGSVSHRQKHAETLHVLRPNLYNAGAYHLRKRDFTQAWRFYDIYLDCAHQPIFSDYAYATNDTLMTTAAYWALYSAFQTKNNDNVLKYRQLAERDTARLDNVLQWVAETLLAKGDTAGYITTMRRGFDHMPSHRFFFPRLIDYYNAKEMSDSAHVIIDKALQTDSTNTLFLFAKSTALLNAGRYEECESITEKLLAIDDTMAEAYANMGLAYYNQAIQMGQTITKPRKKKKCVNALLEKSRPYMEKFRQMAPNQQAKWLPALYTIYFSLNMGKEFDEIDKLRK